MHEKGNARYPLFYGSATRVALTRLFGCPWLSASLSACDAAGNTLSPQQSRHEMAQTAGQALVAAECLGHGVAGNTLWRPFGRPPSCAALNLVRALPMTCGLDER